MRLKGQKITWRSLVIARILPLLVLFSFSAVHAHFNLDLNIRTIHVVHTDQGLDVYMRLPTPLYLASSAKNADDGERPAAAPFTYNRLESGDLMHYLDIEAIRNSPHELASIAASGQEFAVDGKQLEAQILDFKLHPVLEQPPFSSLDEVKRAFASDGVFPYSDPKIYVGATVTDLLLRYRHDAAVDTYSFRSAFNPNLEGQESTANLILDYFPGNVRVHRLTGLLNDAVEIRNSEWAAILAFVRQGTVHILEGLDHVLFVLCLTLGAAGLTGLLWRITGFTLGHTVTLVLGFFGFVPKGEWFIPSVETAIALTIIYAASLLILHSERHRPNSAAMFTVTTGIGLIHGLGFSFVLHELLLPGNVHLWKSLISFNIGVELGQVLIVLCVWGVLRAIARFAPSAITPVRWCVAAACIAPASFWAFERGMSLTEILF